MISALLQHAVLNSRWWPAHAGPAALPLMLSWVVICTLCGCTYRDPSVEILEGELRWMEDQLYLLEDQLAQKSVALDQCRRGMGHGSCPDGARRQDDGYSIVGDEAGSRRPSNATESEGGYEIVPSGPQPTPAPPLTRPETTVPPELQLDTEPDIEIPDRPDSNSALLTPSDASGEFEVLDSTLKMPESESSDPIRSNEELPALRHDAPEPGMQPVIDQGAALAPTASPQPSDLSIRLQNFADADLEGPADTQSVPEGESSSEMVDAHVTHVVAQGRLAHGQDFDDRETEADVLVLVEPRNADGNYVALAGPISIVVLDGEKRGAEARVARWDFDAAETRRRLRQSAVGRGAHFSLTWPQAPPQSDKLYLFVRYVTVEGRKLEADIRLETNTSAAASGQWRVVKPKNRLASWNSNQTTTPLKRIDSEIRLEPIPGTGHPASAEARPPSPGSSAWTERARSKIAPQSPSTTATAAPSPQEREMPVLLDAKDRPQWTPER